MTLRSNSNSATLCDHVKTAGLRVPFFLILLGPVALPNPSPIFRPWNGTRRKRPHSEQVETTLQRCRMTAGATPEKQKNNYRWVALIIASTGTLPVWLDSSFNIAFPAITSAFHLDVSLMQWAVIAYVLTTAS